jgi:hypothetical protein
MVYFRSAIFSIKILFVIDSVLDESIKSEVENFIYTMTSSAIIYFFREKSNLKRQFPYMNTLLDSIYEENYGTEHIFQNFSSNISM